jgi:hypothetical protein
MKHIATILWGITFVLCALTAWLFLNYALAAVVFPAELNIGEGVVLHQAMFVPSRAMYGDIFHYPFMVFEYPPVYLLAVRGLAALGPNLLVAGRAISLASAIVSCLLLAFLVRRSTEPSAAGWAGGAIAAILPLSVLPVIVWVPLMRVDMLGLALTLAGLVLVVESARHRAFLALAMIAFVAAVFTRQTYVAAPLAALCISLLRAPARTLLAGLFGLLLGGATLTLLDALTAGGFFRHVVVYLGHNGFDLALAVRQIAWWISRYVAFWLLGFSGIYVAWPLDRHSILRRIRTDDRSALLATMALYLAIATAMTLLSGKSGAWLNYLIEWMYVGAFWAGYASIAARARPAPYALAWTIPLLLAVQMANGPLSIMGWRASHLTTARATQNAALVDRLKQLPEPVMSDDMVALWQAGKDLGVESFMFAELARVGVLPETDLVSLLQARTLSAIVTEKGPGDSSFDTRYLRQTQSALLASYPRGEMFGDYVLRLPKEKE